LKLSDSTLILPHGLTAFQVFRRKRHSCREQDHHRLTQKAEEGRPRSRRTSLFKLQGKPALPKCDGNRERRGEMIAERYKYLRGIFMSRLFFEAQGKKP
jgi:hypothetical protein